MKKLILLFITVLLIIGLSSCGGGKQSVSSEVSQFPAPAKQIIAPQLPITAFGNRGNSGGNSINGGFVISYREKLFFTDSSVCNKLACLDSGGMKLLTQCSVSNINAFKNWLYFCNTDDSDRIYRCRTNGTEFSTVTGVGADYVQVVDDWIYFSNLSDSGKLYKVSVDGNQLIKISDNVVKELNAYPETVYYNNVSDNSMIYYIATDGSEGGRILRHSSKSFNAYGVYLYYIDLSDNCIYRSSFDGIYVKNLNQQAVCMNVSGDYIYFSTGKSIFRMDFNGENPEKLLDAETEKLSVMDSTIYYIDKNSGNLCVFYSDDNGGTVNESLSGKYYNAL